VNLPVTNVPGCIGSNAKTLGLHYLQFLDMGAGSGPLGGARVAHHGTVQLLIQQNTIPDGKTASPIKERSQPLRRFLSHMIKVFRPGEPFIEGHPRMTGVIDPFDWLPEGLYCSEFQDAPTGLGEEYGGGLRDINGDPPFTQPPL
jgi:hypothetical protein